MIRLHVIPDRLRVSGVCYLVLQISMNNAMRIVLTRVSRYIRCDASDDLRDLGDIYNPTFNCLKVPIQLI